MAELKVKPSPVALIGDIVESRTHRERQALHEAFQAAVGRANAEVPIDDPAVTSPHTPLSHSRRPLLLPLAVVTCFVANDLSLPQKQFIIHPANFHFVI